MPIAIAPTIDAVAESYAGRINVGKLNIDENSATVVRYNVRGIPTLLLFKGGQVKMLDAHVAAATKAS